MRDPYAMFNTHIRTVKGLTMINTSLIKERLDIRFTSDDHETLSISNGKVQFSVNYKDVLKLVEETRKDRDSNDKICN